MDHVMCDATGVRLHAGRQAEINRPSSNGGIVFPFFPLFLYFHELPSAFRRISFHHRTIHQVLHHLEKRWDLKRLVGSGGMPSSHSATVTALAMAVGLQEGFGGSLFAMAFILTSIVMCDATGVRLHAGRQAEVLNQIVYELPSEHPLAESRPLRELLGHTPPQVIMGGILGTATAVVGYLVTLTAK
ncbi:hypothetical protein HID58_046804 [Brassica napus]|uniref:Acid phosphatase/vanadium-dependent haloperoxidase-related protein n=1 Tax=Brassica napus TaxID=3708 RepID=A0ABQ8AXI2_BRANA|nr:hypothetical protein HID58_046804 [Brassica napus]